jgi:tetratricopeptide (TPR) repeat protein
MVDLEATLRSALDGRYAIEGEVGRGGTSVVFRARDLKHDRTVAVKVLKPDLSAAVSADRFHREVAIAASLTHPHILPLFDSGEADGHLFYVMPLMKGETLRDLLERERQLPVDRALAITRDIGSALIFAHEQGVVHRDLKPANILLEQDEAVLADFGVAHPMEAEGIQQLTTSGIILGTPAYMSPEQGTGEARLDGRSDIYSLGCVLYEMLVGEPPFSGPTAHAVIARHVSDTPHSVRIVRPDVPSAVDRVIARCLAKSPAGRYGDVRALLKDLERAASEPEKPAATPFGRLRSHPWAAGAVALAFLAAIGAVYAWLIPRGPPLDLNRIVVFPPHDLSPTGQFREVAPGIAASIGYALEDTEPLRWLEGWDWLTPEQRRDPDLVTREDMERITRRLGAAHFIDGQAVVSGDSVTLIIRLHSVEGPQTAKRAGASAPVATAAMTPLGLRAVAQLIPALVGEDVPPSDLQEHDVAALANWGLGLSAYSRSRFEEAYGHFERALQNDSTLAIAAVDGALTAMWLTRIGDAQAMADIAVRHGSTLSPRARLYAEGIRDYTLGRADPAIVSLVRALEVDSAHAEGWFALGQVFDELVPLPEMLDSVADLLDDPRTHAQARRKAYEKTRSRRPDFWPVIDRLASIELEGGHLDRAREMLDRFRKVEPDSTLVAYSGLILRCLADGPGSLDWNREAERAPFDVLRAGLILEQDRGGKACADGALSAVLHSDSAAANERWGALLTWQSAMVGQGRDDELIALLEASREDLGSHYLYTADAAAGAAVGAEADALVEEIGTDHAGQPSAMVWVAGIRAAQLRDSSALAAIVGEFERRVAADSARQDRMFADVFRAHLSLVRGDTTDAIRRFEALVPTGNRAELRWGPWEVLAYEWLTLARILEARGEHEAALRWASQLDHLHPVIYLAFRPASLAVRIEAARALGRQALADSLARRLEGLTGGGSPPS